MFILLCLLLGSQQVEHELWEQPLNRIVVPLLFPSCTVPFREHLNHHLPPDVRLTQEIHMINIPMGHLKRRHCLTMFLTLMSGMMNYFLGVKCSYMLRLIYFLTVLSVTLLIILRVTRLTKVLL